MKDRVSQTPSYRRSMRGSRTMNEATTWISLLTGCIALLLYIFAPHFTIDESSILIPLGILWVLNLYPLLSDYLRRRFDPFDIKYFYLLYFFVVFTLHATFRCIWGIGTGDLEANPNPSDTLRFRALCVITAALATFIAGGYSKIGSSIGARFPRFGDVSGRRINIVVLLGVSVGWFAFWMLLKSAGGVFSFLNNLSTWRTEGVLAGAGQYTVPISTVMPSCALLFVLRSIPPHPCRLDRRSILAVIIYVICLIPVAVLGFRVGLLTAIIQIVVAWHYRRRRIRIGGLIFMFIGVLTFLTAFSALRSSMSGDASEGSPVLRSVIFRIPGLDTVERVFWRNDLGEPSRGVWPAFVEAATILGPRAFWPNKPAPGILEFDDIYFYDFFLRRGDRIGDIKSGMSPTIVGDLLWIGGIPAVVIGSFLLGVMAAILSSWRRSASRNILHIWIVVILLIPFTFFVEAAQNAFNYVVVLSAFIFLMVFALTAKIRVVRHLQ
jgi:hypothetical protein